MRSATRQRFVQSVHQNVKRPVLRCGQRFEWRQNSGLERAGGIFLHMDVGQSFLHCRRFQQRCIIVQLAGDHGGQTLHKPRGVECFLRVGLTAVIRQHLAVWVAMDQFSHDG